MDCQAGMLQNVTTGNGLKVRTNVRHLGSGRLAMALRDDPLLCIGAEPSFSLQSP